MLWCPHQLGLLYPCLPRLSWAYHPYSPAAPCIRLCAGALFGSLDYSLTSLSPRPCLVTCQSIIIATIWPLYHLFIHPFIRRPGIATGPLLLLLLTNGSHHNSSPRCRLQARRECWVVFDGALDPTWSDWLHAALDAPVARAVSSPPSRCIGM